MHISHEVGNADAIRYYDSHLCYQLDADIPQQKWMQHRWPAIIWLILFLGTSDSKARTTNKLAPACIWITWASSSKFQRIKENETFCFSNFGLFFEPIGSLLDHPSRTKSCFYIKISKRTERFLPMEKERLDHPQKPLVLDFLKSEPVFFSACFRVTAAWFKGKAPIPAGLLATRTKGQIAAAFGFVFRPPGSRGPKKKTSKKGAKKVAELPKGTNHRLLTVC